MSQEEKDKLAKPEPRGNKKEEDTQTGKSEDNKSMCYDFVAMGKCPRGKDCPHTHTTREQYIHKP